MSREIVLPELASRRFWFRHPPPVGSRSTVGWRVFSSWRELGVCAAASAAGEIGNALSARNNVRGRLKRVKPKPVGECQTWFYRRLVAYSFLGLSEGA